jgi:hypothetical protein
MDEILDYREDYRMPGRKQSRAQADWHFQVPSDGPIENVYAF